MDRPSWAPEGVDMNQASPARMYDALLGGSHNFEVDRMAAEMGKRLVPDLPRLALSNRAFLRRAVRFLVDAGITQFVDIGSGIPTVGNVHEVAQSLDPRVRVLYIDIDPVAVAHARSILRDNDNADAVEADLRKPEDLLARVRESGLIDLDRPVGLLLIAVLHLLADDDRPAERVAALRNAVVPGSYVAISHLTSELRPDDAAALGASAADSSKVGIHFRPAAAIAGMFDGWALVEPGVVELPLWRPESDRDRHEAPGRSLGLAGVGHKA
ncbi:SAM-dependent methyltransferase [Nocardia farcinica]|uniref:SAM-dependent methyltransferase n=1 Tax=Nocardia farcinica TaxID=37329 RepID=UPI0018933089|nr:SAM-dependent methyltransferase [Nocardia farcinica]MBF6258250.1 SAM-dependent methyltransferase [Nocardia farcinica]MBF6362051.1 SAM-dependent methyltransferase [Nocardia farcinica]MBF6418304.1 SAM-dependent methyltransferase [Nocardia farcinica]MBF6429781.1 SAM-dependent methyltransferase [Nocardia farcinica]MBF6442438.1 SAM-dependent methyltransferase [Nocardia farcinica]